MDPRLPTLLTAPVSPRPVIEATYLDVLVRDGLPAGTGFSIALPRGWAVERTATAAPGPQAPIVPLARFYPGESGATGAAEGVELVVWAAFLPREMHGADWLRAWMRSQGYRELDFRQAPSPTGMMGDALAAGRHNGALRLHRLLTVKDGDLLFLIDGRMIQGGMAQGSMADHRVMQEIVLLAAMRFRLAEPTGQTFAEGFEWTALKGTHAVRFLASGLWRETPGGDAPPDGASLVLDHVGPDGSTGRGSLIAVLGAAEGSGDAALAAAAEIERTTLAKLANQGFALSAETDLLAEERTAERSLLLHRRKARRTGPQGSTPMTVLSARLALAGDGGRDGNGAGHSLPVCLILLSPDEDTAFEAWAINRRAFEIALSTVR